MVKFSELFRTLQKDGWYVVRQRGSHYIMHHQTKKGVVNMPFHGGKEVGKGLLRKIIKDAGISNFNKR